MLDLLTRYFHAILCLQYNSIKCSSSKALYFLPTISSFLDEVGSAGENASEFFQLYQKLIQPSYLKYYLALQGALMQIGRLITQVYAGGKYCLYAIHLPLTVCHLP